MAGAAFRCSIARPAASQFGTAEKHSIQGDVTCCAHIGTKQNRSREAQFGGILLRPRSPTWSQRSPISMAGSSESANQVAPAGAAPIPEPIREDVVNSKGEKLAGILLEPASSTPAPSGAPLVILCHGFRSSKRSGTLEGVAAGMYEHGLASYRFDFSGNGESEGEFTVGNYWTEVEDLHAVLHHWKRKGRHVAAILGHSKGGNVVLLFASKYPDDVSFVVNVSGRLKMEAGLKERYGEKGLRQIEEQGFLMVESPWDGAYKVTKEDIAQRLATDMVSAAKSIPPSTRVLTVHGSQDETIPVADALSFAELIPNHRLAVIEDADHRFSKQHRAKLAEAVVPFLVEAAAAVAAKP